MTGFVWLASYPKSGNTWFRMLAYALDLGEDERLDINSLPVEAAIASARAPFDDLAMLDSRMLTHVEADRLRPRVYEAIARGEFRDPLNPADRPQPDPYFLKIHDAYAPNDVGEPMFAAAEAVILIVRDPRAVAPSFAGHQGCSIDEAISFMASDAFQTSAAYDGHSEQLRQRLFSWTRHTRSWLEQTDLPVRLVRYEDLKADAATVLRETMRFAGREISADQATRAVAAAAFERLQAQEREKGFVERPLGRKFSGLFFRRGEAEAWRQELTEEQIARIEATHGDMMRRLGYVPGSEEPSGIAAAQPTTESWPRG